MRQLIQVFKTGKMEILEVPIPAVNRRSILVKNYYSAVSVGTEGKTVETARGGYITQAKEKPKEVKRVLRLIKEKGLISTYKLVMNRLDQPSSLGYSCAGEVIAIGEDISDFKVGDKVSCGGVTANHAEIVSVPKNLCTRIPRDVDLKCAAFATIGAIALQGIRQADLRLGESCAVIGLGLIGQLTIQLLHAAGIHAIGIDLYKDKVELAKQSGAALSVVRSEPCLENLIREFTNGIGVDSVIISAGTKSLDPIELAGELCRKKGKVIIVGSVPTGFSRENYYKKELELRMSCSYGPGRYDPQYEEKGIDYPVGHVRWTEKRNMEAFLRLIDENRIDLSKLITHIYNFENSPLAYEMILKKKEPFSGILIEYEAAKDIKKTITLPEQREIHKSSLGIGFIGAGSYAQNVLLPIVSKYKGLVGVADAKPNVARYIADKYGFKYCTGDIEDIVRDERINTVFIATPHDLHANIVLKCLHENKNVFVEKPLCLRRKELEEIKKEYENKNVHLMVGFNRRFSPHVQKLKSIFRDTEPKAINYRINAGVLPADHWIHDKDIGGGRIIGEVIHFVDFAGFIAGAKIESISAMVMEDAHKLNDTLILNLGFENGSIASVSYFSNGNNKLKKEYLEVFSMGKVAFIDDFRNLTVYTKKTWKNKLNKQDKGHKEEVRRFLDAIEEGSPTPISFVDIYSSTSATLKILESARSGQTIIF